MSSAFWVTTKIIMGKTYVPTPSLSGMVLESCPTLQCAQTEVTTRVRISGTDAVVADRLLLDSLLLATHNTYGELRVWRLRIDFENAAVNVQSLKFVANCMPTATVEVASPMLDSSMMQARLTTLDFIPAGPESKSRSPTPPFVLAAFSYFAHDFQGGDAANTIFCKWEIYSEKPDIHSSFAQLSSRRPNASSAAELPVSDFCCLSSY